MADCPNCGSVLKFDISTQKIKCTSCSSSYEPEEVDSTQMAEEQQLMGVTEFICPNCGGEIFSTDKDITGVCSYCGSGVVFESKLVQKQRPDRIIPFQKTKDDCKEIYEQYLKHKLFVPKALKDPEHIDGFRGIYMPYWISEVEQKGKIRYYAQSSKRTKKDLVITDTYRIKGELENNYHGLYHDAGEGFSDDLSEKLEPYYLIDPQNDNADRTKPFYPSYLSGFYAEPCDIDYKDYKEYFADIADRQTEKYLHEHKVLQSARVKSVSYSTYAKLDLITESQESAENSARDAIMGLFNGSKKIDRKLLKEHAKEQKQKDSILEDELKKHRKENPDSVVYQSESKLTLGEKYGYETEQTGKLALFPVWFMSWRNKDRVAYATVNGQTGSVVADLPVDFKRFFAFFGALFVVLFAALSLFTIRSYTMPVFAVWFSAITLHMAHCELNTLYKHSQDVIIHKKRKTEWDSGTVGLVALIIMAVVCVGFMLLQIFVQEADFLWGHFFYCIYAVVGLGYALVETILSAHRWTTIRASEKTVPVFFVSTIAAGVSAWLVFINTPNDAVMYGATAAAFAGIALTMLSLILQFNKVISRPLPQFSHKGGDDRA